ncbi:hypothetical protein ACWIUD_07455 [Helicobacter sp. 23-1044]
MGVFKNAQKSLGVAKIALIFALFSSISWGQSYATKVKQLYLPNAQKAVGRLLPSVEVKMLGEKDGEKDGKVEVEISGWIEDGVPNAVYFVPNRRILVAGIDKKAQYDFTQIDSIEDGGKKWIQIKAKFLTEKDGFGDDLEAMYKSAEEMYQTNCGICHKLHDKKEFNANQWPSMINSMLSRTAISKEESYLLIQYLQKNAKDMPYKK